MFISRIASPLAVVLERSTIALAILVVTSPLLGAAPSEDRLRDRITTLSSDAFEGRAPGTSGEQKTVDYLIQEFKGMGLLPGNPDGTYIQDVPLVGVTSKIATTITAGDQTFTPVPVNDYSAISRRVTPKIEVKPTELVFVGYGVVAPEYGWDDYKDIDVKGKTIVMLINDPPVPSASDSSKLDDAVFKGKAMTYYGRWTYKYDIAAEKGAAACLIIHETGPAGYPFAVVGSNAGREQFDLRSPDGNESRPAVEAWITLDFAKQLFTAAGKDFATLKAAAVRRDFRPVTLNAKASYTIENTTREVLSRNVIAKREGQDPKLRDEYVIYTAHWDHLGRDDRLTGDQIFNGATDNASGTAVMLEIAQEYAEQRAPRSALFLAVTAEEKGLLGSRYYAENPLYPLNKTVANINIDGANHFAPTRDIEVIGSGSTTIEDIAREIAEKENRILTADTQPEKGFFYRSDHFQFAKVGVPAFYGQAGRQPIDKPADYIDKKRAAYIANNYHKVSDEIGSDWDFSAMTQNVSFLAQLGLRLATEPVWPEWRPGSEFKAMRDAMLKK